MPNDLTTAQKIAIAIELGSYVLAGLLQRMAQKEGLTVEQILAKTSENVDEVNRILDELEQKIKDE